MLNPINLSPITQFIQSVKSAELNQQKEVKMSIQQARMLSMTLAELQTRLVQDYETLFHAIRNSVTSEPDNISVNMDGGGFK